MEYSYGYMQTNAMSGMNPTQPEPGNGEPKGSPDVVYVFSDKNKPGIMFRCPSGTVERGEKVYTTPVEGIQTEVQWIDGTNVENQSVRIPTYGGMPYTATTHMVSEEKLAEIKAKIEEAKRKEEETLTIDVNDRKKEFFDDVTNSLEGIALRGNPSIKNTDVKQPMTYNDSVGRKVPGDLENTFENPTNDDNDFGEL